MLGHIDGTGKIINKRQYSNAYLIGITNNAPESSKYLINKGSIAVDGISLTINEIKNNDFYVSIIPLTYKFTNLGDIKIGGFVNIEFDIIEKAVINNAEKLFENSGSAAGSGGNNLRNDAGHGTYNKNSYSLKKYGAEQTGSFKNIKKTDITREFLYENGFLK